MSHSPFLMAGYTVTFTAPKLAEITFTIDKEMRVSISALTAILAVDINPDDPSVGAARIHHLKLPHRRPIPARAASKG
jgi:hypothetical protein